MTDQDFVLTALRQIGLIVADHLETANSDSEETITRLIAVLDTKELADAVTRLERAQGLRVVK